MSRKKSKTVRLAKRVKSAQRREEQIRKFVKEYDVHPDVAKRLPPRKLVEAATRKEKAAEKRLKQEGEYRSILADAKLVAITPDDFEYMVPGVKDADGAKLYREGLVSVLSQYEGKEAPEAVIEDTIRKHMQECLNDGRLIAVAPSVGAFPKLRKLKNGEIMVMAPGDLDYDYLLEQFGAK